MQFGALPSRIRDRSLWTSPRERGRLMTWSAHPTQRVLLLADAAGSKLLIVGFFLGAFEGSLPT